MLGGPAHKRLETLLIELRIPYKHLHNGGNDSNFTLKALLALALRDFPPDKQCEDAMRMRKKILKALVQMPMPPRIADHLEPIPFNPIPKLLIDYAGASFDSK
jgi:DNA polymerase III subunit epsilon-like, C-terminal domain